VNPHNVPSDGLVPLLVPDIPNDENEVEAAKDCSHQVDVLPGGAKVVVPAEDWVGGG